MHKLALAATLLLTLTAHAADAPWVGEARQVEAIAVLDMLCNSFLQ